MIHSGTFHTQQSLGIISDEPNIVSIRNEVDIYFQKPKQVPHVLLMEYPSQKFSVYMEMFAMFVSNGSGNSTLLHLWYI